MIETLWFRLRCWWHDICPKHAITKDVWPQKYPACYECDRVAKNRKAMRRHQLLLEAQQRLKP